MDTGTFNGQSLGDAILSFSSGNIDRSIVERHLLGNDAISTRDRGGGRQTIRVSCYKLCPTTCARATYLETLHKACGNAKATLTLELAGGSVAWSGCLLTASREDYAADAYVAFTLTFVRSAH